MSIQTDILLKAQQCLKERGFEMVSLQPLPQDTEGLVLRNVNDSIVRFYMDGTEDVALTFDVYCRFKAEDVAINATSLASWCLKNDGLRGLANCKVTGVSEYSGATSVSEPKDGMFAYSVGMRVDVTKKN